MSGVYCRTGGWTYWSIGDATTAALGLAIRHIPAMPYHCETCGQYHIRHAADASKQKSGEESDATCDPSKSTTGKGD